MMDDAQEATGSAQTAELVALNGRLRWACRSIQAVALIWILWGLAIDVAVWGDRSELLGRLSKDYGVDPAEVTDLGYASACVLVFVSWAAAALFVSRLWRLARVYLEGRVFSIEAAERMRALGLAGFAAVLVDIAVRPCALLLISSNLLAKIPLYRWIGPEDLLYLLISGFVLALSVIFKTAAEIAGEHAQFV